MPRVLFAVRRQLCLLGGEQPALVRAELSFITSDRCQTSLQDQAKQVIWIRQQNAVCLRFRERQRTSYFTDAAHVVTLVGVEWSQIAVRDERHRREKLNAVGLALGSERHHPIVKTISPLLRRHVRDIGGAHTGGVFAHRSIVEASLW